MKTVGEIIKDKRIELGISLQEIQKQTKIPQQYLKAIEEDCFEEIPSVTTAKGFVRNYAIFLGLSPENLIAIFRRDDTKNNKAIPILPTLSTRLGINRWLWWTPKTTVIMVIALIFLLVGGYLGEQYYRLATGPKLTLISPQDGQIATDKVIVEGDTTTDATVKIQGILTIVDEKGHFYQEMVLPRGDNILTVEATSRNGKNQIKKIRLKVE